MRTVKPKKRALENSLSHLKDGLSKIRKGSRKLRVIEPRVPQKADSERPSLNQLGDDVLLMIVGLLQDTSPGTIPALALVSSYYYNMARYTQHRYVDLDVSAFGIFHKAKLSNALRRLEYIEKAELLSTIRRLQIANIRQSPSDDDELVHYLCSLVPMMTGLTDISWRNSLPRTELLEAIRPRPKIRLHVHACAGGRGLIAEEVDQMHDNQNIYSLNVDMTLPGDVFGYIRSLKHVLLSCPNIRSLTLNIGYPKSGCVVYGISFVYYGFGFTNGERPPALERLELKDYPWGYGGRPRHFGQNVYPNEDDEQSYWAEKFDWSRLEILSTPPLSLSLKLIPQLTRLREVQLANTQDQDGTRMFFEQVPSVLERIVIATINCISISGLSRHGPKLRELQIHRYEMYQGNWSEQTANVDNLRNIRESCPDIEELSIDVGRDRSWPYAKLDILTSFPRLRSLTIWFELGITDRNNPVRPYLTFNEAGKLFRYLRKQSPIQPSPLKQLEVKSGAPPPLGHGYPSSEAFWPESNSTSFTCTLSERDDPAAQGIFETVCPGLSAEENKRLRGGVSPQLRVRVSTSYGKRFIVARDGPTPLDQWNAHY